MRSIIGVATRSRIALVRDLEADLHAGHSFQFIFEQVVRDRQQFARDLLSVATGLLSLGSQGSDVVALRSAVSRYYYAMFQAARGVAFLSHGGDDKNSHSDLPNALPDDFPDRRSRVNDLKNVRSLRNDADYDPYPNDLTHWLAIATDTKGSAERFVTDCATYITRKGL